MTPRPMLFEKGRVSEPLLNCTIPGPGEDTHDQVLDRTNNDTYWRPAHATYDSSLDGIDAGESAVSVIDDFLLGIA